MQIYPAIDIRSGRCVRLTQGDYHQMTTYHNDPTNQARLFLSQGATGLHIVDLDAAYDQSTNNRETIIKITKINSLKIQVGGGIRKKEEIDFLLSHGVERVILGSLAITEPETVKTWISLFGAEKIVFAADVRIDAQQTPWIAYQGWQTVSQVTLWTLLDFYQLAGLKYVLCTDIQRDGLLQGPNFSLYQQCCLRYPRLSFQASGGVRSLADLQALAQLPLQATIVGKALYENQLLLSEKYNER